MRLYSNEQIIDKTISKVVDTEESDHEDMIIFFTNGDYIVISSTTGYDESGLVTDRESGEIDKVIKDNVQVIELYGVY